MQASGVLDKFFETEPVCKEGEKFDKEIKECVEVEEAEAVDSDGGEEEKALKLFFGSIEKAVFVQVQGGPESDTADLAMTYTVTSLTKK